MAISIEQRYPGRSNPADANYITGSFKNASSPGAGDGTPVDQLWANDIVGGRDSILDAAGITPDDDVDNLGSSQIVQAHFTMASENFRLAIVSISASALTLEMFNRAKSNITPLNTPMGFTVSETVNQGSTITLEIDGSPNETGIAQFDLVINKVYLLTRIGNGSLVFNDAEFNPGSAGSPTSIWSGSATSVSSTDIFNDSGFTMVPGRYHVRYNLSGLSRLSTIDIVDLLVNTSVCGFSTSIARNVSWSDPNWLVLNEVGGSELIFEIFYTPF